VVGQIFNPGMFAFHFEVIFKKGEKAANATNPNISAT
jgi:hypothetical protein